MKIRKGFVSNSSSSSFIISDMFEDENGAYRDLCKEDKKAGGYYAERWTVDDIKAWVKLQIKKELEKEYTKAKNGLEVGKSSEYDIKMRKQDLDYFNEYADKEIYMEPTKNCKSTDFNFWYPGRLKASWNYILGCKGDNFIPDNVSRKIIKKFDVQDYDLHMG